jgi:molybdopterin synthase sulfur carrier subunit
VRVRFFAHLRKITGCAEADVPYEETVGALARSLCNIYGEKFKEKMFLQGNAMPASGADEETQIGAEIIILINGRHISHLGGVAAPLKPDDRVDVFPVVAGG